MAAAPSKRRNENGILLEYVILTTNNKRGRTARPQQKPHQMAYR